ncbi:hypothetical protein F2Q70_00001912 [Brassica cretica]|nr:hypothetical protein F2Q70_00001912 [Brassica cretica]
MVSSGEDEVVGANPLEEGVKFKFAGAETLAKAIPSGIAEYYDKEWHRRPVQAGYSCHSSQ